MESENKNEQLPETETNLEGSQEISEEEKKEILSVFSEENANKKQKKGFQFTVRNQLIIIGCIFIVAALLIGSYFLFLKEDDTVEDPFYTLSAETETVLDNLHQHVTVTLYGYQDTDYSDDEELYRTYTFAKLYDAASGNVTVKRVSSGEKEVVISCNNQEQSYSYDDFYDLRWVDQAVYGFNGEKILTNAILKMTGNEEIELPVQALDGYDEDGDTVLSSGGVVMFPMVNKDDISILNITNSYGTYTIYQDSSGSFYFQNCELLSYDDELFASLLVDCRYMVTAGKMTEHLDYSVYGLLNEEELTCSYTLYTVADSDGNFYFHSVRIGKEAASGSYYYAMYFGGKMDSDGNVVETHSNGKIYMVPTSSVEDNLIQKPEKYFTADLVYGVSDTDDCYSADYIRMDYMYYDEDKEDVSILVRNLSTFFYSSNTSSNNSDASNVLKDKVSFADTGLTYTDWLDEDSAYFAGFTSSDAEPFTISASITNIASDGNYLVTFGLLKDEDNESYAALLPEKVTVRYSVDGDVYRKLSDVTFDFSKQEENTVVTYSFEINSPSEPVMFVELSFDMPNEIGYLVIDDIRVYADGEDAVPNDALTGIWRLVQPSSMIPAGKNYTYLDSSNFAEFLYGICMLEGDSVEKVGISTRDTSAKTDDVIDTEILAEYGLDKPAMHFAYTFDGYTTDLYVSTFDEENDCYYAYSTITGDVYSTGKDVTFCTGLIARLSTETASWLEWDPLEYIDRQLLDIYVYEIKDLTISFEGKEYTFNVTADGTTLTSVTWDGTELDEKSFRYLYLSIVQLNMKDAYTVEEESPTEYMSIKIRSTSDYREYVFYRVSSSKAYYTVNGDGHYYCLISALRNVMKKVETFVAGETVS